jgi:hypothetical protein
MKKITLSIVGCFIMIISIAQKPPIAVVTTTNSNSFYSSLATAISLAPAGSIIYLPGGNFSESVVVDKQLTIIGVGHNPDSNYATLPTTIDNIIFTNGSNGSVIDAVGVNNYIQMDNIDGLTITRCLCKRVIKNYGTPGYNLKLEKTIINEYFQADDNLFSSSIKNCIISSVIYNSGIYNSVFANCIFLNNAYIFEDYSNAHNEVLSCIFMNALVGVSAINATNTFQSNIFNTSEGETGCVNGQNGYNNKFNQTSQQTFVRQSGNIFSYYQDYHLKSTSPGKNAGLDGKDIGIYGGTTATAWVDGSLPPNPHIRSKDVSQTTGTDGKLPVKFTITLPTP